MKLTIKPIAQRRQFINQSFALTALAHLLPISSANAATWPSRTVRIVLPFPPGGTSDIVARLLADKLTTALGHNVIVESKAGANGIIAGDFVAKSAADGHTLLFASAAHASNASIYAKLPYDTARDFVPVALVVPPGPMVIAVHTSLPVSTVRELIEYARSNPGKLAYASGGIGNSLHLAGEMLGQMAGVSLLHVPYKGAAPALNDLLSGQVQFMFNSALAVAPFVKQGRLRLIAQTGAKRSSALPADLPTVQEAGLSGFEVSGWFGLFAPAKTPIDIVQRINLETNRAMALPELREKLALLGGADVPTLSSDSFTTFVNSETTRYAKVAKAAGLNLETPAQ